MPAQPLIVEDLLLLLFQPSSGTIAGEGTLFYVLGGAALSELALDERIDIESRLVRTVGGTPPADPLLRSVWNRLAEKPRHVQTLLAAEGPHLREAVLERLVHNGHIRRESRKVLGVIPSTALRDGGTPRRAALLARVRAVLVDGQAPEPRVAAVVALLSASGALSAFHRDIPWSGPVIARAKELERGDWGADAVGAAVARTVAATVAGALVAAGVVPNT